MLAFYSFTFVGMLLAMLAFWWLVGGTNSKSELAICVTIVIVGSLIFVRALSLGPEDYQEKTYSETTPLVSGKDTLAVEGSFFMGSGSITTQYQIRYSSRDEDGNLVIQTADIDAIDDSLPSGEQPYLEKQYSTKHARVPNDYLWAYTPLMVSLIENTDYGEPTLTKTVLHIRQDDLDKTIKIDLE